MVLEPQRHSECGKLVARQTNGCIEDKPEERVVLACLTRPGNTDSWLDHHESVIERVHGIKDTNGQRAV